MEIFFINLVLISVNKCGGNCSIIADPYAGVCVPNKIKNMNVKVFNLMSKVNETRFVIENKSCGWKCELNERVCNSKKKWDHNECRC